MTGKEKEELSRATAVVWLRQSLADDVDELMKLEGFKRTARSVSYTRAWGDGKQKVDFELIVRPRYAADAIQVSMSASLISSEISEIARRMLPEGEDRAVYGNVVQRRVLDQIARNPPVLAFRQENELRESLQELKRWLQVAVLPHLSARKSVRDFTLEGVRELQSRSSDDGLPRGARPVILAAAQKYLGLQEEALQTLEFAYPLTSSERDYYRRAFDVLHGS
ncbi:hypothetical protein AB0M19_30250 [Streptomyces sp. NPDC051920]|uniref:hypothetical protein n=1 Tax=Streptomyces sp. NPDC051920 TaxID=3155523 RepID=UPI00343CFC5E